MGRCARSEIRRLDLLASAAGDDQMGGLNVSARSFVSTNDVTSAEIEGLFELTAEVKSKPAKRLDVFNHESSILSYVRTYVRTFVRTYVSMDRL